MNRSVLILAAFAASLSSFGASAVDMFTFSGKQPSMSQNIDGTVAAPSSFAASLNPAAMAQEEVVFNLPHKQISAIRMDTVGETADQLTPYSFEGQKGFVVMNSKNDTLDNVVIFDEAAQEVFRGVSQADGSIAFTQDDIDTFICTDFEKHEQNPSNAPQTANISYYQSLTDLTLAQVTSLQSRPGASKVLYIDYMEGSVSGTAWNTGQGAPAIIEYENYSYDSDANTFSLIDLQSMYAGWAEAAEDYAPFDVNVTTDLSVYNAAQHINKSKIISTSTNWRNSGGVAYVGVFGIRNDDFYNIGWTFNSSFGSMGMTNSHESGHQMGLSHDGVPAAEYYGGAGNSGPIMGGPFGKDFVHWNNGSYPNANQPENDLTIIKGRLGELADDHGNTNGSASPLSAQDLVGFISPAGLTADVDVFSLTLASATNVDLTVRSLFEQPNSSGFDNTAGGLNLSAKIELRNSANGLIQQKLPSSNAANNGFSYSGNLAAGTYYLSIEPQAYVGANFNAYGNGGYYQILSNLAVTPAPDLVVELPAVSDATLDAGQSFTLSVSVRNQGSASSNATTLTYYRSTDSTINASDVSIGTDGVAALAASVSGAENISLTAPTSPGNYYYGACVNNASGETNTANNCSTGVLVNVASTIDLVVESPSVNDATLTSGQSFNLSASVKNQGNSTSAATTLTYYVSTNSTISTSDTSVGIDAVSALATNASGAESISLGAPSTPGSYYYGACVAAVSGETNTSNNCSTGVLVTVAATIDLIVQSPSVNDSSLEPAQSFVLSANVRNQGNSSSAATTLTYYRSTNSTISTSDTSVGTDGVAALAANAVGGESITLTAPATEGNYYYGACVGVVANETTSNNNCSVGVLVTVNTAPTVDLVVESPAVSDANPNAGQSFSFSAAVKNQGNATSVATTLTYFRSSDATITTADASLGTDGVSALGANASGVETISLTAPSTPGTYYYGACVTAVSGETSTANNCSAAVSLNVAATIDLIVESPSVNDSSLEPAQSFVFSANVKNQGNSSSPATTLTYYRSTNSTISSSDVSVGSDGVGALSANAIGGESITLTAPATEGSYYYGACVAVVANETISNNNCSAGVLITVTLAPTVDLIVELPSVDDASLTLGQSFRFSSSVKNQGNSASSSTTLTYFRSSDSTITSSDLNVGSDTFSGLAADTSRVKNIDLTAPASSGNYFYGVCVTAVGGETDTTNNCSTGVPVSVTSGVAPDSYEPNNEFTAATEFAIGETQNHSIHQVDDEDWLKLTVASAAESMVIETSGAAGDDTRMWLYDSNLNEIAFSDDDGVDRYSKIVLDSPLAAGTYYVLVDEFNNDDVIESYTVSVSSDSEDVQDESFCLPIMASNGNMAMICL